MAICCGHGAAFDARIFGVMLAIALAGIVRGASGFGQALVFVPLAGLLYRPAVAVPMLWVVDALVTPLLLRPHLRSTDWPDVLRLVLGAALVLPVGVWLLTWTNPLTMRWVICTLVLLSTLALAAGWNLRLPTTPSFSYLLGGLSGLAGGATGMSGPPLVLTWLSQRADAARVRSNIFVYLWLLGFASLAVGAANGLLGWSSLLHGLALAPFYAGAMVLGNRVFRRTGAMSPQRRDRMFRRLALGLCAASACLGLPLWH